MKQHFIQNIAIEWPKKSVIPRIFSDLSADNLSERHINYINNINCCKQSEKNAFLLHMNIEQVDEDVYIFISQTMPITRRTQFYGLIQLVSAGLKITREKKTHTFQAIERKYMKN